MLVVNRFRVPPAQVPAYAAAAEPALALLRDKPGLLDLQHAQNLDDPELWVLVTRWRDVGSYRRALGGFDSKMVLVPYLSRSIDEPSAYADPVEVGENRPRGGEPW